jgi:hypothetical protein
MSNRPPNSGRDNFDPGPSFTEDADHKPESGELRNFAETAGDHESPAGGAAGTTRDPDAEDSAALRQRSAPSMPGWLETPRAGVSSPGGDLADTVGPDFFSEDDLPQWLRSLSTDQTSTSSGSFSGGVAANQATAETTGAAATLQIPEIANIWVTASEQSNASPGASLFAMVANDTDTRPEVTGSEPVSGAVVTAHPRSAAARSEDAEGSSKRESRGWTRRERVLMLLVIIAVLVLIFVLGINPNS